MRWLWLLAGGLLGAALRSSGSGREESHPAPEISSEPSPQPEDLQRQLQQRQAEWELRLAQLEQQEWELRSRLEAVAGLTREQALEQLFQEVRLRERERVSRVAREEWQSLASRQICQAMQRVVVEEVAEHSLSTLGLPAEDYKGRIIGKEGRNLRLFESLTGVELLLDDAPGVVTLSCFDPWRRELALRALRRLVEDGRIQPTRIEEAVSQARTEMERVLLEKGSEAAQEAELHGLSRELLEGLGRLAFRTSYRQNVLRHSLEVAWLAARLAEELGADVEVCRRAGLLHDIGKGLASGGAHALSGAELCRRAGESRAVVHAVEAHHEDVPQETLEATLVQVADAISASRPGARRENAQQYLLRLEALEGLARQVQGVTDCHVLQAGREIRVFVRPDLVDDEHCMRIAQTLAQEIEAQVVSPSPVRVTVARNFSASAQSR